MRKESDKQICTFCQERECTDAFVTEYECFNHCGMEPCVSLDMSDMGDQYRCFVEDYRKDIALLKTFFHPVVLERGIVSYDNKENNK